MTSLQWLPFTGLAFTLRLDAAAKGAMVVTGIVAFAVLLYAIGYEKHEPNARRFFILYGVFVAAMLAFLAADSLLLAYVAWEVMSLISSALVGIRTRSSADGIGAIRTLATTRFGDLALLLGIGIIYHATASLNFTAVAAPQLAGTWGDAAIALLCIGALAKSAALPFSGWLPGAMVAPTPVSALLHSATLVAAGPWLLARISSAVSLHHDLQISMVAVLACTAMWGAFLAIIALDAKRVLAYSTIEQLAQASLAAVAGFPFVAYVILAAHAAAKPVLFFAAGDLQRATGSTSLLAASRDARREPSMILAVAFGAISLGGIPPLYSSWSIEHLWIGLSRQHMLWGVLGAVLAFSTGLYLARFALLLFPHERREFHPERIDLWMRYTGIACAIAGFALAVPVYRGGRDPLVYVLPLCAIVGFGIALVLQRAHKLATIMPMNLPDLETADSAVARPIRGFAEAIVTAERTVDALFARLAQRIAANASGRVDDALEAVIETGAGDIFPLGRRAASAISGNVSQYVLYTAVVLAAGGVIMVAARLVGWLAAK